MLTLKDVQKSFTTGVDQSEVKKQVNEIYAQVCKSAASGYHKTSIVHIIAIGSTEKGSAKDFVAAKKLYHRVCDELMDGGLVVVYDFVEKRNQHYIELSCEICLAGWQT